jgi:hypothetical protein
MRKFIVGLVLGCGLTIQSPGQVYNQNVVGYVNVPIAPNRYHLLNNPLNSPPNRLTNVLNFGGVVGCEVAVWDATNQVFEPTSTYNGGGWSINYEIPVGRGFMFRAPAATTLTFVGEVLQGVLTNKVWGTNKLSLIGSMVPQAGPISGTLNFPAREGNAIFQFPSAAQTYESARMYFTNFGWQASEPTLAVAEGFFVRYPGPDAVWIRNFTVNRPAAGSPLPAPAPALESYAITDGGITLRIRKDTKRYNVQFSRDRVNWTDVAVNQTAKVWKGTLPPGEMGFFQVVAP